MMQKRSPRSACGALALLALAGCSPAEPPRTGLSTPPPATGEDSAALVVPDLMALLVDPAAGVLLSATYGNAATHEEPRTAPAWQAVGDAADQLAQTTATLAQPAVARGRTDWLQWTAALHAGAAAGAAAATRQDERALSAAGTRIRAACDACHARYAPDLATPGPLQAPR